MNFLVLYVFSLLNAASALPADSVQYPQGYFRSPLDIPLTLAGNYGEPRRAHFHAGLDFRTNQQEGLKVYAPANGYVSRVNVQGAGYGNALYIRHPNGWVTVYGHLKSYNAVITERLRKEQYSKESFAVDFNLQPGEIPVKKGEVIALSGNTGGSGGPHLHFEIRDTLDNPYNPMLFGFKLYDNLKPIVASAQFYALDDSKYTLQPARIPVAITNGIYHTKEDVIKLNAQRIGVSLNTYDLINGGTGHVGIYNMTVIDGDRMVYEYQVDRMSFSDKRYVLSHVDYPVFLSEGRKPFHKCYVEPGNQCPVYSNLHDAGVLDLSDGQVHNVLVEIHDFHGNTSIVKLKLKYDAAATTLKTTPGGFSKVFSYSKADEFTAPGFKINMPKGCLFDDVPVNYSVVTPTDAKVCSKVHIIGNSNTQTFDYFSVSVKAENLPAGLEQKAIVVHKDNLGSTASKGGKFENGFVTGKAREFGQFYVMVDTSAPRIFPQNITAGRNMRKYKSIILKISDNLSGIADYDTYIDDKWVVTDYDAKVATLKHTISPNLTPGEHTFKITVTDERGNKGEWSVKFLW